MMQLKGSERQIAIQILDALIPEIDLYFDKVIAHIEPIIKTTVRAAILGTPEIQSLQGGQLQSEFGIPDPLSRIQSILDTWINSLIIDKDKIRRRGERIIGGFSIKMIKADWSDVLLLPEAKIYSNGFVLPWLEWLLIEGDRIIIRDYSVFPIFNAKGSRTGFSLMKVSKHGWRVPPQYAGTTDKNFVTTALERAGTDIEQLILRVFK